MNPGDRRWTIPVHQPAEWLTANIDRDRYRRAAIIRSWRGAVVTACAAMQLPQDVTPVRIFIWINHTRKLAPVRDRLNLFPTIKAVVDALTPSRTIRRDGKIHRTRGYGLLPDDSDRHVLDTRWDMRQHAWDGITIVITAGPAPAEQGTLFDLTQGRN